ncbi:hypothetical protein [Pantoea vagans]
MTLFGLASLLATMAPSIEVAHLLPALTLPVFWVSASQAATGLAHR